MAADISQQDDPLIGFITVQHVPEIGHCGGLLLLNLIGRPVEFHCTAPVPENRAQRILYGRTYQSFLYCDQISLALTGKAKKKPALLVTDRAEIIPLANNSAIPVLGISEPDLHSGNFQADEIHSAKVGETGIWTAESDLSTIASAKTLLGRFTTSLPLDEPFERIRQAIEEAQTVPR